MTSDIVQAHRERILEQFALQSQPLSAARGAEVDDALRRLLGATAVTAEDTVLDVACGPGLVVAAFARVARLVTGIDLVPEMIERARIVLAEQNIGNVRLLVGDAGRLPLDDAAFTVVVCRYVLHHCLDPVSVVKEMVRVCAPGGRVALVDVITTPATAAAYDNIERLRDPSHVRALTLDELLALALESGLVRLKREFYSLEIELEELLRASFPAPGDEAKFRQLIAEYVGQNRLGVGAHRQGPQLYLSYPIALLVGTMPD
jgi:ubiquinone/menaquinone biosynthesis C-methylase UbiE